MQVRHATAAAGTVLLLMTITLGVACDDKDAMGDEGKPQAATTVEPAGMEAPAATAPTEPAGGDDEPQAADEISDVAADAKYELRAIPAGPYARGELGRFVVRLKPRGEYHINQDYPTSIAISGPSSVQLPKRELSKSDAEQFGEQEARFDVPFTPAAAGEHQVQAKVSFAVCTEENCIPDERTLALALAVE